MTDPIADTLARLKNAVMRNRESVVILPSKGNEAILQILKNEEFINDFEKVENELVVALKYNEGEPVVAHFERVSKPGQRIYVTSKQLLPVMNGRGISIISTSNGLMSGAQAKSKGIGGEYLCKVW